MSDHSFFKHSVQAHQNPSGPFHTPDYNYYVICPHCNREHTVKQGEPLLCDCGNRLINEGTTLFIENFPHNESLCGNGCKAAKVVYRHNPLVKMHPPSSGKDFFEKMTPNPFSERKGYGDRFEADGRVIFSHYVGNHWTDDSEFVVCPHCGSSVDVMCNGPMVACQCGKVFIQAGSDLFIEDFAGPCKCISRSVPSMHK